MSRGEYSARLIRDSNHGNSFCIPVDAGFFVFVVSLIHVFGLDTELVSAELAGRIK